MMVGRVLAHYVGAKLKLNYHRMPKSWDFPALAVFIIVTFGRKQRNRGSATREDGVVCPVCILSTHKRRTLALVDAAH